jgi:DHA2 family multidrug resistance protein
LPSETTEQLFERYGARYRWLATVTVMLGTVSAVLTTTTVNVAIADIMGAFGIGQDRAQWLSTGALAATTVAMLANAWLVRRFGQRRTFVGVLALFIVSLILAAMSPNEEVLILARLMQGAVAGVLQPLSMYTLFRVFPPERRGSAMGLFGMAVVLAPALGPTLGGVLIDSFNWRALFYMPIPLSIAAMLLGSLFMPGPEDDARRSSFDWAGFALLSVGIGCLLTGLSNGQREGWGSDLVVGMFWLAAFGIAGFVVWELNVPQPLVELRVLANGQFASAAWVAGLFGAGLFGSVYLVPLFVQTIQGFTPIAAGLVLMPAGLLLGALLPVAGYVSDHVPARWLIMAGLGCFALSAWWMSELDAGTSFWTLAWWIAVSRVGLALIKPSLNVAALRALPSSQLSQGAGMINFFRQLGGAFGVNLLSVTLDVRTHVHSESLVALQTGANSTTMELLRVMRGVLAQAGLAADQQAAGALHFLGRMVHAQAQTLGFRDSFLLVAVVFAIGLIPAWIMGRERPAPAST